MNEVKPEERAAITDLVELIEKVFGAPGDPYYVSIVGRHATDPEQCVVLGNDSEIDYEATADALARGDRVRVTIEPQVPKTKAPRPRGQGGH